MHWIGLSLEGKHGPAAAIGATVVVHQGEKKSVYINQWTTTYLTNNDPRLHIGLGENPKIDRLEINWSDGTREVYPGPTTDRYIIFRQGYGIVE
jgi:hypothetical protein